MSRAERLYRAHNALAVLSQAEEHRRDPQLMKDVQRIAMEQQRKLSRVIGKPGKPKK
jgi:hypothetical protein